ncbi:MAG TPA: lactate utilization protein C [Actinophytocola sp.]|uniref:LutC/YkgG family protein n=1 Tax=Actinophytocola sp. TaxID=1872138 RepID=UPI002DDD9917|nr:lactate utilization protein C [Actinophytocola sp.]HEV2781500.1 lactate utilization protein C [Actinophytocola sp.]
MADPRTEILGRIRRALADRPAAKEIPRDYDLSRPIDDLPGLFAARVADYRAGVRRVATPDLPATITEVLRLRGASPMVVPPDVPASWCVPGIDWHVDDEDTPLPVATLDEAAGVLTGCALAIAETGTIVLDAGPEQGRRALTLIPDYHLCVVRTEQIVGTVPEALATLDPLRPLTFISGPSATSDIELNRVEGVHGPRTLEVLLTG